MKPVEAAPELREFLHRPENAGFLEFYEYWQRKGAGKGVPFEFANQFLFTQDNTRLGPAQKLIPGKHDE